MTPAELPKFIDTIRQLQQAFSAEKNPAEKMGISDNFSYYIASKMGSDLAVFFQEAWPEYPFVYSLLLCDKQLPQLLESFYKRLWKSRQETQ